MSDTQLLPCPFCGHDTPEFERTGTSRQSCIVICGDCGARHESSDEYQRSGQSWNTRASQSAPSPVEDKDGVRYRWLRSGRRTRQGIVLQGGARSIEQSDLRAMVEFDYWCTPEELDAAIDRALAQQGAQ